jgi:CheY-like chemotaxis protein
VGQGTTIKVYLPRHRGAPLEDQAADLALEAPRAEAGETVLVVEDEPVIRDLIVEVLRELGYRALEAADGSAGLKVLQSRKRIDLLVTDVGLPGVNGRQLADQARVTRPDLKVLFITGYAEVGKFFRRGAVCCRCRTAKLEPEVIPGEPSLVTSICSGPSGRN